MYNGMVRLMTLIIEQKDVKKAAAIMETHRIPSQYIISGQGTASSEILDYLGLGSTEKAVIISVVPASRIPALFGAFTKELKLCKPNKGVAFTIPLTGASSFIIKLFKEEIQQKMIEHLKRSDEDMAVEAKYCLLMVTINQGYSEEVMEKARRAGATGGTVLHARRIGSEEPLKRWGINLQSEKEIIYILTEQSKKLAIMRAIGENSGLYSEAQGMVMAIPVEAVAGSLFEKE